MHHDGNENRLSQHVAPAEGAGVSLYFEHPRVMRVSTTAFFSFRETTRRVVPRRILRQLKTTKRRKCGG